MKISKLLMSVIFVATLAACNNGGSKATDASNLDTATQNETQNPDVGSEEMNQHHATDSMGQKTTGGH
jgi:hypothetical protein